MIEESKNSGDVQPYETVRELSFASGDLILGRYRIVGELGQGGMGVVYRCRDEVGGVEVAVKCLPRDVSRSTSEMEDVRRNYQIVQGLIHENIAALKTLECDEGGDCFVVMELVRGVNLKRWAEQHAGTDGIPEKIAILRQIAQALDYAHSARPRYVIHRDIKPENVMVDDEGHVKVLDFGLAAQVQSSMSHVSMMVTSRSGTAAYKSPEQWRAQVQKAAADQYSLGVVAYCLFAGAPPFDSDDVGILRQVVLHDPIPPIEGLPKAVFRALQRALAKDACDRFDTCGQFVDALEGKADAGTDGLRLRVMAGVGICVVFAGLVGAGIWGWQARQRDLHEKQERIIARQETERAEAERKRRAKAEAERAEAEKAWKDCDGAWVECTNAWNLVVSRGISGDEKPFRTAYGHWVRGTNLFARAEYASAQLSFEESRHVYLRAKNAYLKLASTASVVPAAATAGRTSAKCQVCGGTGFYEAECSCTDCYCVYERNTGKVVVRHGTVCEDCDGLGYRENSTWSFGGNGRTRCASCGGTGHNVCEKCKGSGKISVWCQCVPQSQGRRMSWGNPSGSTGGFDETTPPSIQIHFDDDD